MLVNDLDNDALGHVFSYFSDHTVLRILTKVCRRWRLCLENRMKRYIVDDVLIRYVRGIMHMKQHDPESDMNGITIATNPANASIFETAGCFMFIEKLKSLTNFNGQWSVSYCVRVINSLILKECAGCGVVIPPGTEVLYRKNPRDCPCTGQICAKCDEIGGTFCCVSLCQCHSTKYFVGYSARILWKEPALKQCAKCSHFTCFRCRAVCACVRAAD